MSKWDRARGTFNRAHDDLFDGSYDAEFFNHSQGTYDPNTGEMTGQTRSSLGTRQVEIVPPAMDSTVDVDGTSFSWDTSIRFPQSEDFDSSWGTNWGTNWGGDTLISNIIPLGDDNRQPTEIEISEPGDSNPGTFELHSYAFEKGSGMVMCRLVEQ